MGRIVTSIETDGEHLEVWTGSPDSDLIHVGTADRSEPFLSLTKAQAERFAIALMSCKTRLMSWSQTVLDLDVVLESIDVNGPADR